MTELVKYDITDAAIAEMEGLYMGLVIVDLEDKEQFDAVHSARMVVKGKRVEVEKRRKELKADALEWGRKVDSEAKRIFGKLEPIETHLDREEKKVTDEQKRIKEEADRKERENIEKRVAALAKFGVVLPFMEVATMPDEEFAGRLTQAEDAYLAEQKRLADEAAARKAENERLEKVRKEQEAEAAKLAEAQRKIDEANAKLEADKKALADEKKAEQERKDRETFEAQAKENARIQAEKDAKGKAEREVREAKERVEQEAAEKARAEALRPDKEKLLAWASDLLNMVHPNVKSEVALDIVGKTMGIIYQAAKDLNRAAREM